jgi:plasmid stabilization system protein ParE
MDIYRIRITPRALSDLTSIFDFIRADSPQNADKIIRALIEGIDSLERFPQRFATVVQKSKKGRNVRSMVVYPFVVRFRIEDGNATVCILHVRRGARRHR